MNTKALHKLEYGLFVVTSNDGVKDNGLILNTVMQLTSTPTTLAVSINKDNYSHDVIEQTKKMNVCILDQTTPFSIFQHFGLQSGRDVNKFADTKTLRSKNGLVYLDKHINAYMSLEVLDSVDMGTHSLFICSLVDAEVINDNPSVTYAYYHQNIKPNPNSKQIKGYVCSICGYVHEDEILPNDFICPWCSHGPEFFEPIK